MNAVFLDTVGMIAVWDDSDQWHAGAEAMLGNVQGLFRLFSIYR